MNSDAEAIFKQLGLNQAMKSSTSHLFVDRNIAMPIKLDPILANPLIKYEESSDDQQNPKSYQ